jgi:DNA-binding transcriptional regulator YhcF (GntR family)
MGVFVVKLRTMTSITPNANIYPGSSMSSGAGVAGSVAGAAPTFSPLYQQIKALITQGLQSGEWKPGELIPSEMELASRFKVSQGTVRKAIDELSAENLVVRRQGRGLSLRLITRQELSSVFSDWRRMKACHIIPKIKLLKSAVCGRRLRLRACLRLSPVILWSLFVGFSHFQVCRQFLMICGCQVYF